MLHQVDQKLSKNPPNTPPLPTTKESAAILSGDDISVTIQHEDSRKQSTFPPRTQFRYGVSLGTQVARSAQVSSFV